MRTIIIGILLGLPVPSISAQPQCTDHDIETNITIHPASQVTPWQRVAELGPVLKPEHVIPARELQSIESRLGQVTVNHALVTPTKPGEAAVRDSGIAFEVVAGGRRLMTFQFYPRKDRPGTIEVHNLEFKNEANPKSANPDKLAPDQSAKGFSMDVFRFAVQGLMHFVEKSPYQSVMSAMPQHYGVYKLYQRFGKFEAMDKPSSEFFAAVDSIRTEARKWPEPYKVKNLDDYVSLLGTRETSISRQDMYYIHQQFLQSGKVPDGVKVLRNSQGEVVALAKELGPGEIYMQFINYKASPPELIDWYNAEQFGLIRDKI